MTVSSAAVANAFLQLAKNEDRFLTNMQVQKLVYLANGFYLGAFSKPLHYDETKAWKWGPVIPNLYKKLQQYGSGKVEKEIEAPDAVDLNSEDNETSFIKMIWNVYKDYSGWELSRLTHLVDSPWAQTWKEDPYGIIEQETMQNYHKEILSDVQLE